jgi:3-phosphoshikimate 1-carboxyvinyltransferase
MGVWAPKATLTPLRSAPSAGLKGTIRVPGDKSISHRALIFGALAVGETRIEGLLEGADVLRTAQALRAFGARIARQGEGAGGAVWRVNGVGVGGLGEPDDVLDLGNSGTGARLLMGLAASQAGTTFFTGDASLRRRPMKRVAEPLTRIGARFVAREGLRLPLAVIGAESPLPIEYRLPVASAQVKSAVLFAGLNAPGKTTVIEPEPTRDHTENLLRHFGAEVAVTAIGGGKAITVTGQPELRAQAVAVPGDPSSAAFIAVAAAIVPGSKVTIAGICANPLRIGLFTTLREMGADLAWSNPRQQNGEAVADLTVSHGGLKGVAVPPDRAPSMIDEYPILCVAAAFATGDTIMRGAAELRVKESDRIALMAQGLTACGIAVEELPDGLIVRGRGRPPPGGAMIATALDHRIAMSFLVLGMAAKAAVAIDDAAMIDTSFPDFAGLANRLGAAITAA